MPFVNVIELGKMRAAQKRYFVWGRSARCSVTVGVVFVFMSVVGHAQLQTPTLPTGLPSATGSPSALPSAPLPTGAQTTKSNEDDETNARGNNSGIGVSQNTNDVLTASQITAIVQTRPELVVDLKQVMADYLEQQGNPVQADSITDDMLYRGIASDVG